MPQPTYVPMVPRPDVQHRGQYDPSPAYTARHEDTSGNLPFNDDISSKSQWSALYRPINRPATAILQLTNTFIAPAFAKDGGRRFYDVGGDPSSVASGSTPYLGSTYVDDDSTRGISYNDGAPARMEKRDRMVLGRSQSGAARRRKLLTGCLILGLVIAAAVAIPIALKRKSSHSSEAPSVPVPLAGGPGQDPPGPPAGGDGSTITTEDGTTFIYHNPFGGLWVDDPDDPFNNDAQAQSWVPPLNQSWDWNKDRVLGSVSTLVLGA